MIMKSKNVSCKEHRKGKKSTHGLPKDASKMKNSAVYRQRKQIFPIIEYEEKEIKIAHSLIGKTKPNEKTNKNSKLD